MAIQGSGTDLVTKNDRSTAKQWASYPASESLYRPFSEDREDALIGSIYCDTRIAPGKFFLMVVSELGATWQRYLIEQGSARLYKRGSLRAEDICSYIRRDSEETSMKHPLRQRLFFFLGGLILVCLGISMMLFGDTRLANSAGGMLAGMGTIFNLLQLFFKLPLEFPSKPGQVLILTQSIQSTQGSLILPSSYYEQRRRQQQARRARIFRVIFSTVSTLLMLLPLIALGYMYTQFPIYTSTSCTIITKRVEQDSQLKTYSLNFNVQVKDLQNTAAAAFYPANYPNLLSAQKELDRFLVGHTYACHVLPAQGYAGVTSYNMFLLDADYPLSSPSGHESNEWRSYEISLSGKSGIYTA